MNRFKVGDRVKRTDSMRPAYLGEGIILKIISDGKDGRPEWAIEYEVGNVKGNGSL
jgi:hypothetical protein